MSHFALNNPDTSPLPTTIRALQWNIPDFISVNLNGIYWIYQTTGAVSFTTPQLSHLSQLGVDFSLNKKLLQKNDCAPHNSSYRFWVKTQAEALEQVSGKIVEYIMDRPPQFRQFRAMKHTL